MNTATTTAIIITAAITLLICVIAFKTFRFICRILAGKKSSKVDKLFKDIDLLAEAVEEKRVTLGPEVRAMIKDIYKRVDKFACDISDESESDYTAELLEPLEHLSGSK